MNWDLGHYKSAVLQDLNWDFSKMSSSTLFSIALLAVLVILLIVLIIVTIKVLSKGRKEDSEEYTERKYNSHEGSDEAEDADGAEDADEDEDEDIEDDSDTGSRKDKSKKNKKEKKNKKNRDEVESGDGDDDEDEEDVAPVKPDSKDEVAAVVEAALQAKAKAAELEARVAKEKAEQAAEEAEKAAKKASQAEAEAKAAAQPKVEEEETEAEEDFEEEAEAEDVSDETEEDDDADEGEDFGRTDEIPVARIRKELEEQDTDVLKAKTQIANADEITRAVKEARRGKKPEVQEDSAFGENAFPVEEESKKVLDTSFDSAFTDTQLHQEIEERKEEETEILKEDLVDSAFGVEAEAPKEEEIRPLQVAGDTITVNPVNAVNIHTVNAEGPVQTTNPEAGINDPSEMNEFLTDNPVPKKEKKKMKKRDAIFAKKFDADAPRIEGGRFLWYNNQDIEALTKKEDMYYHCHYFDDPTEAVLPLIIEMYDCAFVRTEEIQKIAYGINYKSMGLREILTAREDVSFDRSKITKEPSEQDMLQIRAKWVDYVDNFLQIIVIKAPDHMQDYIREQLYAYGENDVDTLLFCPEPEDEEE